jgi:hypothetical protein
LVEFVIPPKLAGMQNLRIRTYITRTGRPSRFRVRVSLAAGG